MEVWFQTNILQPLSAVIVPEMQKILSSYDYAGLISAFLFTLCCAWQDLRTRRIQMPVFVIGAWCGTALSLYFMRGWRDVLTAMLPGMAFFIMSRLKRGSIGAGDVVYVLVCGLYMNVWKLLMLLVCAAAFSSAAALIMLMRKFRDHADIRKMTLPYMAFIAPAFLGLLVML